MRHRVSAFAIRHPRPILLITLVCAIAAGIFGSKVVPRLTSQTGAPSAPSAIAENTIRDAAGINVTDDVVVLVTPTAGLHTAAGTARVAWVESTLSSIKGIAQVQAPVFTPTVAQVRAARAKIAHEKMARERAKLEKTAKQKQAQLKTSQAKAKRLEATHGSVAQLKAAELQLTRAAAAAQHAAGQVKAAQVKAAKAADSHKPIVVKPRLISSSQLISLDGKTAIVLARYYSSANNNAVSHAVTTALGGRSDVEIGGYGITVAKLTKVVDSDLRRAELIAFSLLLIVGLWVFRSVVATLVPLTIGALTIATALLGLRVANHYEHLSEYVLNVVMGVGLGLAIDYSLFIISRYREEAVIDGYSPAALLRAMDRAGRTVAFSAVTVAAALSSLLVFPQRFLLSMGIGSAITVMISAFSALVVLPALLSLIGPRIDCLSPKSWRAKTSLAASDPTANVWYRLTRRVIRRPVISVVGVLVIVGFALSGAFHVRFASVDARTLPASYQVHSVYQQLLDRFNPDLTRQLNVAWVGPGDAAQVNQAAQQIKHLQDAASVGTPTHIGGDVWKIPLSTRTGSFTKASSNLVLQIRHLPSAETGGGHLLVGGTAADFYDLKHSVTDHMPLALLIVGVVVLLIVFVMTDSVVLAIKTFLINAMNVAAVIGVLVWVFEYGHFQHILQFTSVGSLDFMQPILIIMISFALSTDYGVFLLARIKEEHDNGRSTDDAITYGLGHVGRVITYAAILLCVALGAFATSRVVVVKEIGVGAAFAIVLDASLIRAILVPAAMKLFGPLNWWSPRWTRPLLRRIHGTQEPAMTLQPAMAGAGATAALALPAGGLVNSYAQVARDGVHAGASHESTHAHEDTRSHETTRSNAHENTHSREQVRYHEYVRSRANNRARHSRAKDLIISSYAPGDRATSDEQHAHTFELPQDASSSSPDTTSTRPLGPIIAEAALLSSAAVGLITILLKLTECFRRPRHRRASPHTDNLAPSPAQDEFSFDFNLAKSNVDHGQRAPLDHQPRTSEPPSRGIPSWEPPAREIPTRQLPSREPPAAAGSDDHASTTA